MYMLCCILCPTALIGYRDEDRKRGVAKRGVWPTETSLEHVSKNNVRLTYIDWQQS